VKYYLILRPISGIIRELFAHPRRDRTWSTWRRKMTEHDKIRDQFEVSNDASKYPRAWLMG